MLLDENVKEILTVIENLEKSTLKDINSSINENIDLIENKFSTVWMCWKSLIVKPV